MQDKITQLDFTSYTREKSQAEASFLDKDFFEMLFPFSR